MALPADIQKVNLTFGPYWDGQGNPISATITARRSISLTHLPSGGVILPTPEESGTDGSAQGVLPLIASDSGGISPQGFTYEITVVFSPGSGLQPHRVSGVSLPAATTTVDLDLLLPAEASPGVPAFGPGVLSVVGRTGVVTAQDLINAGVSVGGGGSGAVNSVAGKVGDVTLAAADLLDVTAVGRGVMLAPDANAARSSIGAGTSNLALGTTSTTAKPGDYQPTTAGISDATTTGRSLLTAIDATTARNAIGAGTSSLAIGTTSTTAKAGNYQPTAANISDSTATGRSVLTAATVAAAQGVLGVQAKSAEATWRVRALATDPWPARASGGALDIAVGPGADPADAVTGDLHFLIGS